MTWVPEEDYGTGYDVLLWMEEIAAKSPGVVFPKVNIHTGNISAAERMIAACKHIQSLLSTEFIWDVGDNPEVMFDPEERYR